jgi:hypothetical protein
MQTKIFWKAIPVCLLLLACGTLEREACSQVIYNNASTAAEGYARGLGDMISAQGDYNLSTSKAAINMEEAAKRDIDNRLHWTNTYFEMKKTNQAYQDSLRKPRPTMEEAVRYAQIGMPSRLNPKEFDYVTGKIVWQKVFDQKQYEDPRANLDGLFAKRAKFGGVSFDEQMEIVKSTNSMLNLLRDQIRDIPTGMFISAKKFIESLAYESQLPPNG